MKNIMKYQATKDAKELPRAIQYTDGSWVGIGGSITRENTPPSLPTILAEATKEQYEELYKAGFTSLIEAIETKKDFESIEPIEKVIKTGK